MGKDLINNILYGDCKVVPTTVDQADVQVLSEVAQALKMARYNRVQLDPSSM